MKDTRWRYRTGPDISRLVSLKRISTTLSLSSMTSDRDLRL